MKLLRAVVSLLLLSLLSTTSLAQEDVSIKPASEVGESLDLQAVSELFKDSDNLEAFEKSLNDPEVGVNNLDLDNNDKVDYVRVVEQVADETHIIILQVQLSESDYQDVATIEVEKTDDEAYNMQIRGSEVIYGYNYYVAPTHVHIHTWPIIGWMYRPYYRPYRSAFYFGVYPRWWRPWRPVKVHVYRTNVVRYTSRRTFHVTRTNRVTTVHKVNYQPRSSTVVTKKTRRTIKTDPEGTTIGKKTTRIQADGDKVTTTKKGIKQTVDGETGQTTTVKKGAKKVTDPETGKSKVVRGASKKTTNPETGEAELVRKKGKKVENPEKGVKKGGTKTTRKSKDGKAVKKKEGKKTSKGAKTGTRKGKKSKGRDRKQPDSL